MSRGALAYAAIVALGACQTGMDHRPRLTMAASVLQRLAPAPAWHSATPDPDLGDLLEVGDGQLLGWTQRVDLTLAGGGMLPGHFVAVTAGQEPRTWQVSSALQEAMQVLCLGSHVVVLGRGAASTEPGPRVLAVVIDPATGRERWRMPADDLADIRADHGADNLVVLHGGVHPRLEQRSLADGRVLWSARLPTDAGRIAGLFAVGDDWLIACSRLVRVAGQDGNVAQVSDPIGAVLLHPAPHWTSGGLVVATEDDAIVAVNGSGRIAWRYAAAGRVRAFASDDAHIYALSTTITGGAIASVDAIDGTPAWRREVDGHGRSSLLLADGRLAFTTGDHLRAISAADGSPQGVLPLPARARRERLPDHLFLHAGRAVVAGESFVGAADLAKGTWMWTHEVQGGIEFTYPLRERVHGQLVDQVAKAVGLSADEVQGMHDLDADLLANPGAVSLEQPTPDLVAHRLRAIAAWQANPLLGTRLDDPGAAAARRVEWRRQNERIQADYRHDPGTRAQLLGIHAAGVRTGIAVERITATLGQMATLIGLHFELQRAVERGVVAGKLYAERVERQRKQAVLRAHRRSVQAGRYLRPFRWSDGSGLLVVDLNDGRWCELILAPRELGLENLFIGVPPTRITEDGRLLLTHGPGVDGTAWRRLDVVGDATVSRSILAFALPELPMRPAAEYSLGSIAARGGG